jgi:putative tricarboxylic transport membrane protein
MLNNDQLSSIILFVMGMLVTFFSIPYGIGNINLPGTGFLPFYTGLVICFLAIGVFVEGTISLKRGVKWKNPIAKVMWWKPLIAMAAVVVYALVLNVFGYIITTTLLVGFLLRAIEPQKWVVVVIGSIITALATHLLFKVWLGTQLPAGFLGF